ncbi:hypothetical protein [Pseudomonas putida]|uniref:hypothetical protein n=1 Tax=Pseudomonas putida TaxID=303 RepID=UPI0039062615
MAISAFGDELDDSTGSAPTASPAAPKPKTAPAQPQVSAFGDPLSAFGDPLDADEVQVKPVPTAQPQQTGIMGLLSGLENQIDDSVVGDAGRSLARGGVGVGDAVMGLAGMLSGGRIPQALGYDSTGVRRYMDSQDTPARQASRQALEKAEGFGGTVDALIQNPGNIPHTIIESVPSMLAGGGVGRGIASAGQLAGMAPRIAGILGAGAGEGVVQAGQQAEQTRQQTGTLTPGQSGLALASGALTGLLGAAGARIGRRLGVLDIDAQMAGQNGVDVAKGLVNRALVGTGIESLEELTQSGQQQVLTNLATDRPAMEGVTKQMTMGGIVGGAMGGAAGLHRPSMSNQQPEQPTAPVAPQVDPRIAAARQAVPGAIRNYLNPAEQQAPIMQQPAPVQAPQPVPFAGSSDISPLLDNLGVQGEKRTQSLDLLRPAEQDIEARRRGVVTLDEQRRLANLIGLDGAKAQAFSRQIGQAWSAEQTIAATDAVAERMKSVMEQQQRIASGQATDLEKASFVQDLGDMKVMFGELMGARAESGRALAAQRRQVQNINEAQRILEGIGGIQGADDLAAAIGKAVQAGGVQNLAKLVGQPETKMQRLLGYYFRSALLSGVRTHAVNITSNSLTLGNEIIERGIAAGIGGAKRLATGGKSGQTVFAEPLDLLIGMSRGMAKAGTAAADAFRTGESAVLGGQAKQDNAIGLNNTPRQPGVMGTAAFAADRAASLPYRALGAEDAFFATLNYEAELRTLARQQALNERSNGQLPRGMKLSQRIEQLVQDPTPKMIESAGAHARENTFNTKAGVFAQAVMGAKAKAPWLNLIVPFVRTPANVVKFGLKRTPMAPLFKEVREDFAAGGTRQERAAARIVWGTGVMIGAGMLAQAGYITGAGPDDKKEREALLNTGWKPYSIRVGGTYHEYSRLDPFAQWLGLAADMATLDPKDKDAGDITATVLGSLVSNTINKTYMQGLSNFVEFLQDPKRNAEWYSRQMAGTMAQPFTMLSNIASENDPYRREGNSILDAIKYRLPGWRNDLPTKLDAFGAPVPNREYPGGPFSIAAPIARSTETSDPVRREAARLGWSPAEFQKSMVVKGAKHEFTPEQHHELAELAGQLTHRGARRMMQTKEWLTKDDEARKEALNGMATKVRGAVKLAAIPWITSGKRGALDRLKGSNNIEVSKK